MKQSIPRTLASTTMAAAAKSAQAEARAKSKSPVEKRVINNTDAAKPLAAEAPQEQEPKAAKTPSLFEAIPVRGGKYLSAVAYARDEASAAQATCRCRSSGAEHGGATQDGHDSRETRVVVSAANRKRGPRPCMQDARAGRQRAPKHLRAAQRGPEAGSPAQLS